MVFHHVGVDVSDFDKSKKLYDALLKALEVDSYELPGHVAKAYGSTTCSFRIVQDDSRELSISSSHICLAAPSSDAIKKFYKVGTALGAEGLSPPNEYDDWGLHHHTTMIKDYDGNRIEAVYVDKV